jgi:hypothetical protein
MPLNVDSFRSLVGQTRYGNRDIFVGGEGKSATCAPGQLIQVCGFAERRADRTATT